MASSGHSLTTGQLRDLFEKLTVREKKNLQQKGIDGTLQSLSTAIKTMQDAGIDIAIDVRSGQYANAYDLVFSNTEAEKTSVTVYGFFHIGGVSQLWALADRIDDAPAKKLVVSQFSATEGQSRIEWSSNQKTPGTVFDFAEDTDALAKLQLHLTNLAANRHVLRENDAAGIFGRAAPASAQGKMPSKKGLAKPGRP